MKRLKSKVQFYEDCLGMPAASWAFNCHLVATRAIENGCLDARAQYGFYTGHVSDKCEVAVWKRQYAQKVPIRHGWAVSEDGVITDLTRWVFEGKAPYIAVIYPTDKEYGEYDQGMAKFKERLAKPCPARDDPRPNLSRPAAAFQPGELEPWIMEMTGDAQGHPFTMGQIIWLANLGPQHLGERGRDLYRALEAAGLRAFVPTDFWDEVMRRNPDYRRNTDESIRRLERLAKQGDIQAQASLDAARRRVPCQHLNARWDRHPICICGGTESCSICTDYPDMINNDYIIEHVKECLGCRKPLDSFDHSSDTSSVAACTACQETRRNPDVDIRDLERLVRMEPTTGNLIRLYTAQYRAGLPGMGLEKIRQWWGDAESTLGDPGWIGLGGLSAAHYPIHPLDIFGNRLENLNRWHGYWRGHNPVRIIFLQTMWREPKYMEHRLEIVMGTGRGLGEFPNGYKFQAFLLDSGTLAILPPDYGSGTGSSLRDVGLAPWPIELLQPNTFGSLAGLLDHLGERLFLYERGRDLVSVANQICNNCGHPRVVLEWYGHQYYRCNRCE